MHDDFLKGIIHEGMNPSFIPSNRYLLGRQQRRDISRSSGYCSTSFNISPKVTTHINKGMITEATNDKFSRCSYLLENISKSPGYRSTSTSVQKLQLTTYDDFHKGNSCRRYE